MLKLWESSREELSILFLPHPPSQNTQPVKPAPFIHASHLSVWIHATEFSCIAPSDERFIVCGEAEKIQFNRNTKGSCLHGWSIIQLQKRISFVQQNPSILTLAMKGQIFQQLNVNADTWAKRSLSITINHILLTFSSIWDRLKEMICLWVKTAQST